MSIAMWILAALVFTCGAAWGLHLAFRESRYGLGAFIWAGNCAGLFYALGFGLGYLGA